VPFPRPLLILITAIAVATSSQAATDVPIRFARNLVWVGVDVAGRTEPLHFLLDTGAGATVLNIQTASELGLRFGPAESIRGVNGPGGARWVSGFNATVAGFHLPDSILAVGLQSASRACGCRIDGLLGSDFFEGRVVQIDYRAGKLRVVDRAAAPAAGALVLPLRRLNGAYGVPVSVAGNPPEWMRLDTGCDEALQWVIGRRDRLQTSPTVSIGLSSSRARQFAKADVRLGMDCISDVPIGIQEKEIFPGESGLLGNGLLSRYRITIDTRKNRVVLEKNLPGT
jgi:hypothetical protein